MGRTGRRGLLAALLPLAAAPAPLLLAALGGATRAGAAGTPFEDVLYGYFLDRYPLFGCVLAYGAARLVAVAVLEPGRGRALRAATAPLALAAFLAAGLYPTFGGLVLRGAFMTGGIAFQNGTPLLAAHALGAAAAALVYGAALGLGLALIRMRLRPSRRGALGAAISLAGLWLAFTLLALPPALGLDPLDGWPLRPLTALAALAGAGIVVAALLPHAAATAWLSRGAERPARSRNPGGGPAFSSG